MVLFSWFLHTKKSLNDIQAQKKLTSEKQQALICAQQAMWPIAKPREQIIPLSPNIISCTKARNKTQVSKSLPAKYKQVAK